MERMFEANQNKAGHQASSGPQDSSTSVPSSICEPSMMAGGPTTNVGEDYARQMIPNVDMDPFRKRYHVAVDKVMEIGVLVEELRGDVQEVVASNLHRGNDSIDESIIRLSYGTDLEICESGTRVEILTRIRNWADDANHPQQIFWLSDAAGTGKSTVATTIAKEWQGQGRLGGRFFFNPNVALDQDIRHFCRIVAYDIVSNHPQLATSINSILIASPEDTMDFAMQFVRLILDPLQSLSSTTSIFLVIDALDNCEFKSRQRLLNVVLKELRTAPRIKLLLTSRPIPDIGDRLSDPVYICEGHLLDINNRSHEDIARYVRANLDQQLDIKEQERIVQYSDGVFIWAATFCRAFKRSNLAKRLLDDFSHSQVADPLDALYLAVLKQALVDKNTVEDFRKVLQVVISVFQPISINSISTLFPKVDAVNEFVQDLGAVFKDGHPDRPIKVLHPTFREFIASNEDRANGFLVQMEPSHSMLAMACLDVLEKTLKYDILDIRSSFSVLPRSKEVADLETRIARKTSPALRYASSYWIHHVSSSEEAWDCWRRVTNFLRDHHLHWAEFMGWRGTLAHGIRGLSQIGTKIGREALTLSPLRINSDDFFTLRHATHFLLRFQDIIHTSPLHAYTIPSELVPTNSPLVRSNDPKTCSATVKIIGKEHLDWIMDAIPLALPAGIKRALLSPDGARVVMSGLIGYLRLWDANTGELIPTSFSAEEEPYTVVQALEFSPDGRYLAIATDISEVHLLDVLTGDTLWKAKTYLGHLHLRIGAMCFLPNESYLAVVLHYKGFDRMWQSYVIYYHIVSGEQSTKTVGLSRFVDTFKVCPGGTRAVYTARGSRHIDCVILAELVSYEGLESDQDDYDGCVYLLQLTIPLSLNRVIEISIDGTTSAIYDPEGGAALILLDCTTGKHIEMVDLDEPYSQCAVFAPQGDLMATASSKGSGILLREKHSGRITKRFGTTHSFSNIWFSSDSQRLASLSNDQRIRIWEVKSGAQLETFFDGYTPGPRVSLSHDWTRLLCIQGQEALVYDLTSKVAGPKSRQSNQNYRTGEYIAENSMLVVRSGAFPATRVLSIWSTASGTLEPIATLGELPNRGVETCITPDLCEILCWSSQGDISLYSLVTYKRLPVSFENVKGTPQSAAAKLCFTSNGRLVALLNTSNNTEAVQVWEYRTGRHIMDTQHRKDTVKSYTLSDTYLAVSTFDQVQVYRVIDGNLVAAERISSTKLMTFSPNSDKLAVFRSKGSSKGPLLQAWAVSHTGLRLMGEAESENEDHTLNDKYNLGFSADGMLIVYGSLVWELGSEGLRRYQSLTLPKSLEDYPHSLLTYANGWIHSAFPPGPIVPIPTHLRLLFTTGAFYDAQMWSASGNTMLVWTRTSEPLIFDFSEFVSH